MPETTNTPPRRKRSSWLRKLMVFAACLVVLLVVAYFTVTSSAFIRRVALPRVGKAINAELAVQDVALSPFSGMTLRKLVVKTTGPDPLIAADEVRVRYNLRSILRGNIEVHEASLIAPTVHIVQEPDGKTNLDPLLKKQEPDKPSDQPLQLDVRNVALKNANVRLAKKEKDGASQTTELSNVDLSLDQLKNGQSGKLTLSAGLNLMNNTPPSAKGTNDLLEGKMTGAFTFAVDAALLPQSINGNARLEVSRGEGTFRDLTGLSGTLQADMTPAEIKQVALRFERSGQGLAQLALSGPLNLNTTEGRLKLEVQSIDRNVLNLLGATQGWDFGNSQLNSTNLIEISQKGSMLGATGQLIGRQISIRQNNQAIPTLDLNAEYQINVNLERKTASVQTFNLLGKQNQRDLLRASLDRPMNVNWGSAASGLPDSTFQLTLQEFNVSEWQAVLGTNLPSGKVDLQLKLQSQKDGKQLTTQLAGQVRELAAQFGANAIKDAEAKFDLAGTIEDLKVVDVEKYNLELLQRNQPLIKGNGSARYDLSKNEITSQSVSEAALPAILSQLALPDVTASNGHVKNTVTFTQKADTQSAIGNLVLSDFTGRCGEYGLQNFQSSVDYDVEIAQQGVEIRRGNMTFSQAGRSGGGLELTGQYHLTNQSGKITFKLLDLNQNVLGIALAPSLGQMKLISASLNGTGSATHDPKGESAVKAAVTLANCVIDDPQRNVPRTPLHAELKLDGSLRQQLAELRQCVVALRQGNESAGNLDITGRYNLTNQVGQASFKAVNLNQNALRPVLASALGDNKLVSINVNGNGSASCDPKGDSAINADVAIANWVVEDPQKKFPRTPLSAQLKIDSSLRQQILDLRQFAITLSPTQRAQNQLQAKGRVDMNKTNATPSQLTIQAESLDVTPYYNMFAGSGQTNTPAAPQPPANTKPGEPEPVELPIQQLTADLKVDRFYLRELAITNLRTTAKINRGEITVKPLQMSLNGAPVNASAVMNLSVPGCKYELALDADKIPLEPLANTFSTNSTGQYRGELVARAQLRAAGITGANLQKSLAGQLSLSLTNLSLEIVGKKTKRLLEPIALVLRVPELTQTPLNWVNAQADIGQGKIGVNQFAVLSHAFFAEGKGTVSLAEALTNSPIDMPVNLALRRSLAEKAKLVPPNAPTNTAYVSLPTFVKLEGTLGEPKTEINKLVISGLLLQSAGNIPKIGDKAGSLLQGIGGILSGQKPAPAPGNTNRITPTNSPAPPKTNRLNPLDLLELIPKKK